MYDALILSPSSAVVGVSVTDTGRPTTTKLLLVCVVSLADVQARIRIWFCVALVHVNETSAPVVALAVHATLPPPDTLAEMLVADPAAPHDMVPGSEVPDL